MDDKTRDLLFSMLKYVHHWKCDVACGLKPTMESLSAAQLELVQAMEPSDVEAAEPNRWNPPLTDEEEYRAVWAGQQAAQARAMANER